MQPDRPLQPDGSVSCPDHPCDGCYLCRRRCCCRQDRPDFPRFGDWTQRAIAEHLGLTTSQVRRVLTGAQVTRLLGEPPRRQARRTVSMACAICGAAVERQPGALRDRVQTTCGPVCRRELRRRVLAARPPLDRATRIRAGEAFRQKLASPEFRQQWEANQRAAKRRRGRPHADALRALPPEAFAVLEERERELVRRYYGLDGSAPETQRALATRFRMTGRHVRDRLEASLSRLLAVESNAQLPDGTTHGSRGGALRWEKRWRKRTFRR